MCSSDKNSQSPVPGFPAGINFFELFDSVFSFLDGLSDFGFFFEGLFDEVLGVEFVFEAEVVEQFFFEFGAQQLVRVNLFDLAETFGLQFQVVSG